MVRLQEPAAGHVRPVGGLFCVLEAIVTRSAAHKVVLGVGVFGILLSAFGVSFPVVELFPLSVGVAFAAFLIP